MLDHLTHPLKFKPYSSVKHLEGAGNWAVDKYYKWPHRYFYRHKVRMIERMLRGRRYSSILDFGAGPNLMSNQWSKYAPDVYISDEGYEPKKQFDLIICASVMEFVPLKETFNKLYSNLNPGGHIIVASPMKSELTQVYFDHLRDINTRHGHEDILSEMSRMFNIREYDSWLGLYFCALGIKR